MLDIQEIQKRVWSGVVRYKDVEIGKVEGVRVTIRETMDRSRRDVYGIVSRGCLVRSPIIRLERVFPGFNKLVGVYIEVVSDDSNIRINNVTFRKEIPSSGELKEIAFLGELVE